MTINAVLLLIVAVFESLVILWLSRSVERQRTAGFDAGYALAEGHAAQIRDIDKLSARIEARVELIQEMRRLEDVEDSDETVTH